MLPLPSSRATVAPSAELQVVLPSLKVSGGIVEALRLVSDLEACGATVHTVSMWQSPGALSGRPQLLHFLSGWSTRLQWAPFQLPLLAIRFLSWARRPEFRRCDWIFTHYATLPLALLVPRSRRWFFVQGLEWKFVSSELLAVLMRRVILSVYRRSHLLAANAYLEHALKTEGLAVRAVAPIWADAFFGRADDIERDIERDIDVLMMLRKGGCKRLDLYLQAIDWFREHAPDLRVAVITTEDEIDAAVREKVVECHIRPSGKEAMRAIYQRSKVFLHLSEHEGFALPPLEAMGCGCVPLCRDSGGPQAYMTGPMAALLRPLDLPLDAFCGEAVDLLAAADQWEHLSAAARLNFHQGLAKSQNRAILLSQLFPPVPVAPDASSTGIAG